MPLAQPSWLTALAVLLGSILVSPLMSACKLHVVLGVSKQLAVIVIATPVKYQPPSGMMSHTQMVQYWDGVLAELHAVLQV
jgi:hypothetical protein